MKLSGYSRTVFLCAVGVTLASVVGAQTNYQTLRSFGVLDAGTQPHSGLLLGWDGALYGTTLLGGMANRGTVFRLSTEGSGYTVLHHFSTNSDGKHPVGALLQGHDGALYGSTAFGGTNQCGTIFKLRTNGDDYAVLHHFNNSNYNGQFPYGRLVQDESGNLYGTTSLGTNQYFPNGGTFRYPGLIYTLGTNGVGFTLLFGFPTNYSAGQNPGGLIRGHDGMLYGVSQKCGGAAGGIFKLNPDGSGFTIWTNLPTSGTRAHLNALRQGTNGLLYGTICYNNNAEAIFSTGTNGSGYMVLHTFLKDGVDGENPDTQLLQGLDGAFYGTTVRGGTNGAGTIFKLDGATYTTIYHFKTNGLDGGWPEDSLIQGGDGKLYGTTLRGGFRQEGTVYSINPDGTGYRQLHQFNSNGGEGRTPSGSLVADDTGALYGTTRRGGDGNYGTLFKLGFDGKSYSVLRHFGGSGDGQWPSGTLLHGQDGAWYGTTYSGASGYGTIFRIAGDGSNYAQLHAFSGASDGDVPYDALVQDATGLLYGTTAAGGSNGVGTVFKLNTNGADFQVLRTFLTNGADGAVPAGELLLDASGTMYGVTELGGTNKAGTIFSLRTDGSGYTILHHFSTNGGDGIVPSGGLSLGSNGNLYGVTQGGGAYRAGTSFSLKTNGSNYGVIHSFSAALTNGLTFAGGASRLIVVGGTGFGTYYEGGESNGYGGFLYQIDVANGDFNLFHGFGANSADGRNPSGGMVFVGGSSYGITESGGEFGMGSIYAFVGLPTIMSQPKDQIASAGDDVSFNVAATGGLADYQWYCNGVPLTGATDFQLTVSSVQRTNAGIYYVTVSNLVGMVVSSNALLTIHVATHLGAPRLLAEGKLEVISTYADGWPLTTGDLGRFIAQMSSNLIDWVNLPSALVVTNGAILLSDTTASNSPVRFYRILEFP